MRSQTFGCDARMTWFALAFGLSLAALPLTGCVGPMKRRLGTVPPAKPMEERPHPEFIQTAPGVWTLREDSLFDLKIMRGEPNPKYDNLRQPTPSAPPISGIVPIQPEKQGKTEDEAK